MYVKHQKQKLSWAFYSRKSIYKVSQTRKWSIKTNKRASILSFSRGPSQDINLSPKWSRAYPKQEQSLRPALNSILLWFQKMKIPARSRNKVNQSTTSPLEIPRISPWFRSEVESYHLKQPEIYTRKLIVEKGLTIQRLMRSFQEKRTFYGAWDGDLDRTISIFDTLSNMCPVNGLDKLKTISIMPSREAFYIIHPTWKAVPVIARQFITCANGMITRISVPEYFSNCSLWDFRYSSGKVGKILK